MAFDFPCPRPHQDCAGLHFQVETGFARSHPRCTWLPTALLPQSHVPAYVAGKPKNELLFPFTRQWANKLIVRYGQAAGLPKAKLHMYSLRHSIAHHLLDVSDLSTVQRRLGHKSISSTSFYVQTTDEKASEAVELLTTKGEIK